jgi:hypothetical protein
MESCQAKLESFFQVLPSTVLIIEGIRESKDELNAIVEHPIFDFEIDLTDCVEEEEKQDSTIFSTLRKAAKEYDKENTKFMRKMFRVEKQVLFPVTEIEMFVRRLVGKHLIDFFEHANCKLIVTVINDKEVLEVKSRSSFLVSCLAACSCCCSLNHDFTPKNFNAIYYRVNKEDWQNTIDSVINAESFNQMCL